MSSMEISDPPPPAPTERTGLLPPEGGGRRARGRGRGVRASSVYRADAVHEMTLSRRLAMFLSRFRWYNPHVHAKREYDSRRRADEDVTDSVPPPSLAAGWAYFEHVSLPRHFIRRGRSKGKDVLMRAEAGEDEEPTQLYSVWKTPEDDLADFGMGVGLYFFTLRCLAFILFVAGCINIPNLLYYSSSYYNDDFEGGVDHILKSSAICTNEVWVACPTCTREQWDYFPKTFDRFATASEDENLKFIKMNNCGFSDKVGYLSFFSLLFVFVSIVVLCYRVVKRREVRFDEASQTTSDYSVQVQNPPGDARDADEWRDFFSQFGQVVCCTVVLDNEELIRALVERRQLMLQLSWLRPPGTKFSKFDLDAAAENALPLTLIQKLMMYSDAKTLLKQIRELDAKIEEYSGTPYDASEVFVIFETEQEQRGALRALSSISRWDAWTKKAGSIPKNLLFRGEHWLRVKEPPEPGSVRWMDLDETRTTKIIRRCFTSFLTFFVIIVGCVVIRICRDKYGPAVGALVISALNTGAPYVCMAITDYEYHNNEGSKQTSRFIKITASMWVYTAIITSVVTPFTDTLSNAQDGLIRSLYAIYFFELLRGPVTQALDISGNVYRHLMGPRATDQESMELLFQATAYELSERYTNMTSMLFLTFYYGTIFPAGFFFAAGTLVVHYWTDKFCLLRIWAQAPRLGSEISRFCRLYIVVTLICFAVISSYYVASVPFDNTCDDTTAVSPEYVGNWTLNVGDGTTAFASIVANDTNRFFCNQDMLRYKPYPAFPAVPGNQPEGKEWMNDDQKEVARLYGWTSVFVILAVAVILTFRACLLTYRFLFGSRYKTSGAKPGLERFDDVAEIYGYVPQIKVEGFPFAFIVCDISSIDPGLIGWNDPYRGHDHHNVLEDVPGLMGKQDVFSMVKDWPDPTVKNEEAG